jgi:predicted esterase
MSRVARAVEYMGVMYAVDSAKVFLAGVSDGATSCYAVASAPSASRPFAGFFAISGFGGMLPDLGVRLSPENMKGKPIYNIQGGQDKLYPITLVNGFIDYLQKNGVPVTSKVYPEEAHGFDYREQEFPELARLIGEWARQD